ncbi:MAG: hypothetical protein J7496_09155 [Novosphingobium sp.]|nr:hypothetical protein [Novosphingobium sp.]
MAQDASPAVDAPPAPVVQAPPAAAPAAPVAPTTVTAPVVQSLPSGYVPANAAAPETAPQPAPSAAPAKPAAPRVTSAVKPAAAPAPTGSMASAANDTASTASDPAPAAPADQAAAPVQLFPASQSAEPAQEPVIAPVPAARAVDDFTILTGAVGGLTLIALGWLGVTIHRRRKARRAMRQANPVTRPVVTPRADPLVTTGPVASAAPQGLAERSVSDPAPVMADPQAIPAATPIRAGIEPVPAVARAENAFGAGHARWADDHRPSRRQSAVKPASVKGALPSRGASVDLPAKRPETYEEREALFKRMVEAKPDKANPFTDRRARMKRARLIIASLGRDFGDARPWIDLSQYPNNWPELARRYPQAA